MAGKTFIWIGTGTGDWSNPANWSDATDGITPSAVVPGTQDVALFANTGSKVIVSSIASAASVDISGNDTFYGNLNVGTLTVDRFGGILGIGTGVTIAADTLNANGLIASAGSDIAFIVAGSTIWAPGTVGTSPPGVAIQTSGTVTLAGTTDTIDLGSTIWMTGTLSLPLSSQSSFGQVVVNGVIASGALTIGGQFLDFGGTGSRTAHNYQWLDSLDGTGTVEVLSGGSIVIAGNVTTLSSGSGQAGVTFQLDGGATLALGGRLDANNRIDLTGDNNTLVLGSNIYPTFTSDAAIAGFNTTDRIIFNNATYDNVAFANGTLTPTENGFSAGYHLVLAGDFSQDQFTIVSGNTVTVACFAQGTCIATPRGAIAIENLHEGDTVTTVSGTAQPIRWIGRRSLNCRHHPAPERVRPVRIAPHAFGQNRPKRALLLSPDHSVFVEDVLIPIKFLINGATIAQIEVGEIVYYHLELAHHDVVLAEGLPAETYLETGGRAAFENGGAMQMHPDFAPDEAQIGQIWHDCGYAPLLGANGQLDRVARQLALQAVMLGYGADGRRRRRA